MSLTLSDRIMKDGWLVSSSFSGKSKFFFPGNIPSCRIFINIILDSSQITAFLPWINFYDGQVRCMQHYQSGNGKDNGMAGHNLKEQHGKTIHGL